MNKTEETELLKEARENISWWLNNGNPKSNFVEHAFNTTTNILHQIDEHLAQSQSPDKEQPRELNEILEKMYPPPDRYKFYETLEFEVASQEYELNRKAFTEGFLSGKGAQGRETKWITEEECPAEFIFRDKNDELLTIINGKTEIIQYQSAFDHWTTRTGQIIKPVDIKICMPMPELPNN